MALALVVGLGVLLAAITGGARRERADLVINNGGEVRTLDPATVSGVAEGRLIRALFEGLTVMDPVTLEARPGVAASWERSEDGLTWTFHLRPDAYWITPGTDEARFGERGARITAHDFVGSWTRLLHPATAAEYGDLLWCVRGAREYGTRLDVDPEGLGVDAAREEELRAALGLTAPDDDTLVVELVRPTPYFLDLTATVPLSPIHVASLEAARERWPDTWPTRWITPEAIVTNGPFRIVERRLGDRVRVVKNPVYWDAEKVALGSIDYLAVEHLVTMLNLYLTGEVDWIDRVPTDLVPRLLRREDYAPAPHLGTYFYRVNVTRAPFDDVRLRRALALAIDRRAICEKVGKAGQLPNWGFLPHGFEPYARAELDHADPGEDLARYDEAFAADLDTARALLTEAGYGDGATLPPVEILYNVSGTHRDIAEVVADGWRRYLGIETKLVNQEFKTYLDAQRRLDYQVSRSSWMGDFVDPSNFLEVFRGGGANNRTGWKNARYDALLEEAADEVDEARRLALLAEAEGILMSELPILPIWTYVTGNVVNPRLGGFSANVLDIHFPKFFHWLDDEALAEKRRANPPGKAEGDAPGPAAGMYAPAARREGEAPR